MANIKISRLSSLTGDNLQDVDLLPIVDLDANNDGNTRDRVTKNITIGDLKTGIFASPTFTGTPLAPTATASTNNTQIATTEFVTTAIIANSFTLPEASASTLGGIKVGTNLSIDADGVLSADAAVSVDNVTIGLTNTNEVEIKDLGVATGKLAEFIDDDTFTTGVSATSLASSESIKAYTDSKTSDPSRGYNSTTHSTVSGNIQQNTTGRPLWVSFTLLSNLATLEYLRGDISTNSDMSSSTRIGQLQILENLSTTSYDNAGQVTMIVPNNYYWSFSFSPSSTTERIHSSFVL